MPTVSRNARRGLALTVLLAGFGVAVYALMPAHSLTTENDESLVSHRYDVPPSMAAAFAPQFAVRKLGWRVSPAPPSADGTVTLEAPGRLGISHDYLTVSCAPDGPKYVRVIIRGRGNGPLAAQIHALQDGMDDKLPAAPRL